MRTTFLGQGYETTSANAIGNHLIHFLNQTQFHSFTGISAFASEAAILGLSDHIKTAKNSFKTITLIVGIDLGGTSKEALNEILNLDINGLIYYQAEPTVFHPKIYLFEGDKEVKIIIGSSNLTSRGLFVNVESSVLIEFDLPDQEGETFLSELKIYYSGLFNNNDPNLFIIDQNTIDSFVAKGVVPDESTRRQSYNKTQTVTTTINTTVTNNDIKIPKRIIPKIPPTFLIKPSSASTPLVAVGAPLGKKVKQVHPAVAKTISTMAQPALAHNKVLVWQKSTLSKSDAQYVPAGTYQTGNLKLSQANFSINGNIINQITYFRDDIFKNLAWNKTKSDKPTYEETMCSFTITILGVRIGTFDLKLSYDLERVAGQGNTPMWLHWGPVIMKLLRTKNITGKTLNLYSVGQNFELEIV